MKTAIEGSKNCNFNPSIYTFQHKSGEIFKGFQRDFYKKFNLNPANVTAVVLGKRKSHQGWKIIDKIIVEKNDFQIKKEAELQKKIDENTGSRNKDSDESRHSAANLSDAL